MESNTDTAWLTTGDNPNFLRYCYIIQTKHNLSTMVKDAQEQVKYLKQVSFDTLNKRKIPPKYVGMKPSTIKYKQLELTHKIYEWSVAIIEIEDTHKQFMAEAYSNLRYRQYDSAEGPFLMKKTGAGINLPEMIESSEIKKHHDEYLAQQCIDEMLKEEQ